MSKIMYPSYNSKRKGIFIRHLIIGAVSGCIGLVLCATFSLLYICGLTISIEHSYPKVAEWFEDLYDPVKLSLNMLLMTYIPGFVFYAGLRENTEMRNVVVDMMSLSTYILIWTGIFRFCLEKVFGTVMAISTSLFYGDLVGLLASAAAFTILSELEFKSNVNTNTSPAS